MRHSWSRITRAYRGSGADLPYGDPRRAHGVAMEGYFWRFTDRKGGAAIVLVGINRDRTGSSWTTLGIATSRGDQIILTLDGGEACPTELGVHVPPGPGYGGVTGNDSLLSIDVPGARVDLRLSSLRGWPREKSRPFGGSSIFQCIPGLNQYWHPWALGGQADGTIEIDGTYLTLDSAEVYGEKNWGREGFPDSWWWGQAQGFGDGACVAFAGGRVEAGPLHTEVTAMVVALPGNGPVFRLGDPGWSPVHARITEHSWELHGLSPNWQVDVHGTALPGHEHVLPVPLPSDRRNTPGALEHLDGRMEVAVRRRGHLVWQATSELAGLEHGGLAHAQDVLSRRGAAPDAIGAPPVLPR